MEVNIEVKEDQNFLTQKKLYWSTRFDNLVMSTASKGLEAPSHKCWATSHASSEWFPAMTIFSKEFSSEHFKNTVNYDLSTWSLLRAEIVRHHAFKPYRFSHVFPHVSAVVFLKTVNIPYKSEPCLQWKAPRRATGKCGHAQQVDPVEWGLKNRDWWQPRPSGLVHGGESRTRFLLD